jgi:hypothetical protein
MDMVPGGVNVPEVTLNDPVSGFAANVPVTQQGYPGWWLYQPDDYQRLLRMRQEHGLVIDDGDMSFEPEGDQSMEDALREAGL